MPEPLNKELYENVKKKIMASYKKNSAFASGAIVKEYKRQGGEYSQDKKPKNLKRWFDEKWVDVNPMIGITNDDAYPVFRPTVKINNKTPTLVQEIPVSNLKEQYKLKQKYKGDNNLPRFKTVVHKNGGKISFGNLRKLLDASYRTDEKAGDFVLDKDSSSKTSKVYINPDTKQVVVAHRGTSGFTDWFNNLAYAYGGEKYYKMTPRYKEAEKVQRRAEEKYGTDKVSTIGHSQGGLQAELLGKNSKEIITLNKATRPFSNVKKENQYDIRSDMDAVSSANPFQPRSDITIKSDSVNPLKEHSIDILDRLDKEQYIGRGLKRGGMIVKRNPFNDPDW